ncbi:MAG: biotin--[acetyl-CoA-carboxylase] ligase, partial [Parasporobacterium sp.]|nr:biotin--[acetyl-CoA-carboxylase] ligase [Parasporobacterium sp.]
LPGGDSSVPAEAIDIDDECRLIVRYEDGRMEALSSGEVSVRTF